MQLRRVNISFPNFRYQYDLADKVIKDVHLTPYNTKQLQDMSREDVFMINDDLYYSMLGMEYTLINSEYISDKPQSMSELQDCIDMILSELEEAFISTEKDAYYDVEIIIEEVPVFHHELSQCEQKIA